MKSMVYVVVRIAHGGEFVFDKVFHKKSFAEQYVSDLNKKIGKTVSKVIPAEFADTEFFIENKAELKEDKDMEVYDSHFVEELAFTKKAFALINQIYFEEDKSKRVNLAWEIYNLICKKDDGTLRTYEEVTMLIYSLRIKMHGQIGAYIQPDAEIYFYTKVLPILLSAMDKLEEITIKWLV